MSLLPCNLLHGTQLAYCDLQLLEYGAPVDATDLSKGRTALHKAMKASVNLTPLDAKMINLLLDSGANPFACDNKGDILSPKPLLCTFMQQPAWDTSRA